MRFMKLMAVALALCMLAGGNALARQGIGDAAHLRAVADMLDAISLPEVTLDGFDRAAARATPANRQFIQHLRTHTSIEEVRRKLVPMFAPLVSTAAARQIADAYRTPLGQRALAYNFARIAADRNAVAVFSAQELQAIRRFDSTAPARALAVLDQRSRPLVVAAVREWLADYQDGLFQAAQDAVLKHGADFDAHAGIAPTLFVPVRVGIAYLDDWIEVLARTLYRRALADWQIDAQVEALALQDILVPAKLVSAQEIAASKVALDKLDLAIAAYFVENDLLAKEFAAASLKIDMPGGNGFVREVQDALRDQLEWSKRFAANERSTVAAMRNILAFAAERPGRLSVKNGTLTMSATDIDLYNGLLGALQRTVAQSQALDAELAKFKSSQP